MVCHGRFLSFLRRHAGARSEVTEEAPPDSRRAQFTSTAREESTGRLSQPVAILLSICLLAVGSADLILMRFPADVPAWIGRAVLLHVNVLWVVHGGIFVSLILFLVVVRWKERAPGERSTVAWLLDPRSPGGLVTLVTLIVFVVLSLFGEPSFPP